MENGSLDGLIVAGMDPSAGRNCGMAVISLEEDSPVLIAKYTKVFPEGQNDLEYLQDVYDEFQKLIDEHSPSMLAVERSMGGGLAFVRNVLSETVGVVKLCCHRNGVEVYEVSPSHLKKEIAGHGKATKASIMNNVRAAFDLPRKGCGTDHELDAAGMALCRLVDMGWKGYEVSIPYKPRRRKK
jgi:Holliday junction resolvasome RuvABC endonuclease subunit